MKGALLVRQKGQGCDYTIACGKAWFVIEGEQPADVTLNALKYLEDEGFCSDGERELDIVLLVSDGAELNLLTAYRNRINELKQQSKENQARIDRENELAELARLQDKYKT